MHKCYRNIISLLFLLTMHSALFAQLNCGAVSLDSAEYRYSIGRFDECIESLNICLSTRKALTPDEKIQAFHLLAKCYLATDSVNRADSVIEELLLLKENFETDVKDPDRFKNEVALMRSNIISSVSKRSEDIRLAPATSAVITREEILQRGYTDLIDVLKDIPGFDVSVYYGQLYANVYQRGLRTNNTDKTLLLVDGIEENDLWSNFADMSQQYPLTNIKRIEIIYGPASTMYGPNAFSGVINIITKDPGDYLKNKRSFGVEANTGVGTYNTRYVDVSTAYKKDNFSFSITGRFYQSSRPNLSQQRLWDYDPDMYDDTAYRYKNALSIKTNGKEYLVRNNLPFFSPYYRVSPDTNRINLTPIGEQHAIALNKALYDQDINGFTKFSNPAQASYINAKVIIGDLSLGFVSWIKDEGIGTTYTDMVASVSGSEWHPAHHYAYFNYSKRLNDKLLFTALANYRVHTIKNGSKITSIKDYSVTGGLDLADLQNSVPASWLTTYYYEQSEQFRSELKLVYNQSKYFYLVSGVEVRNSQLQGYYLTSDSSATPQNDGTFPESPGGNQYDVNDIGIYSQGRFRTKFGLGVTLGARLDYDRIRQGGGLGYQLSPRLVFDYVKSEWVFKTIISKGIQNVSNFTKFDDVTILPNPALKSESIYNYEISASKKISANIIADVDFYYSKVKDVVGAKIVTRSLQNVNIGIFNIVGVQANFYYKSPDKKWQTSLNYSFTYPKQTQDTGNTGDAVVVDLIVADIAAHKGNATLNYTFLKNFNINLRSSYVSNKLTGFGTTAKGNHFSLFNGYTTSNITLGAQNLIKGATIQIICNNIFNKQYYSPGIRAAGGIRAPNEILQMGRNFSFRINYEL